MVEGKMIYEIREQLQNIADDKYKEFVSSLLPGTCNILGVRLPLLRKLAKEMAGRNWGSYLSSYGLEADGTSSVTEFPQDKEYPEGAEYFEEVLLQGMVIGYIKADAGEILQYVAGFVPEISNWSICDSFCAGLKFTTNNKKCIWSFLQPYLKSDREYDVRFGVVMLLNYYIEKEYIGQVFELLGNIRHEGYYVKMAAAWAISVCYVKFPEITMEFLKKNKLDDFTYNKALQKIIESNRVDSKTKDLFRRMKRRN